jgi:hypothetical protein
MPPNYGTRQRVNGQHERVAQGAPNSQVTRDIGMSKLVTAASITFGSNRLTAANGTFTAFAVNDPIEVFATSGPRGFYTVTGIDSVNQAYLTVDPPPAAAGPVTASVRTP